MIRLSHSLLILLLCTAISYAADKKPATKKPQAKKPQTALQKAYQKSRELFSELNKHRARLGKNPELIKLRKAWLDATESMNKKLEAATVREQKSVEAAQKALTDAIDAAIKNSSEIAALQKKQSELEQKRRATSFQIAQTELQLNHPDSPVQQALDADPTVKAQLKAYNAAKGKERNAARAKYFQTRRDQLKKLKVAQKHLSQVESLKNELKSIEKQRYQIWRDIAQVRRNIQYGKTQDKTLTALREKLSSASKAKRKALYTASTKEVRAASSEAWGAYMKKLNELSKADRQIQAVQKELSAVSSEIRALSPKKKPTPKKKPATSKKPTPKKKGKGAK